MTTYWMAGQEVSERIAARIAEGARLLDQAYAICKECGGEAVYTSRSFGSDRHAGFSFADESKVDKKKFVRLKGTPDGWRPRARNDIAKRLHETTSWHCMDIMKIIGMNMMGPGCVVRTPGCHVVDGIAYLAVPDDVTPKGCSRISDIQWEEAISKNKPQKRRRKTPAKH